MKNLLFILLLIISSVAANAGEGIIFKGKIIDSNSREALAGVEISIENSTQKVYTDLDGYFELKISAPQSIEIKTVSYETTSVFIPEKVESLNTITLISK